MVPLGALNNAEVAIGPASEASVVAVKNCKTLLLISAAMLL